jgi:hypothetical protein
MPSENKFPWLKAALLFMVAYPVCLILWLPTKDYYTAGINYGGAQLARQFQEQEVHFAGLETKQDRTTAKYTVNLHDNRIHPLSFTFSTSVYAFNVPLIFALLVAFAPFLEKKKKPILIIIALVLGIPFLYVVLKHYYSIKLMLQSMGYPVDWELWFSFLGYLVEWLESLVLRFLPFLCGFYLLMNTSFFKKNADNWP